MIQIGLTGWGDHPDVYHPSSSAKEKLIDYSAHFPIVELDSTFYALYTWVWENDYSQENVPLLP
ncbi:uncharacterized protein YecE (DUF72 family) [Filibacter limicola]|uniref:Uncharacterized protein YecE (DUF72 family) n=1 Tax=Sporosarcina limicola TaxID=34101 RepID=A0A927MKL4_9BACL|nr:uncharacterized protein YecE (DUF72 family) [Sporosarcina limicola]